MSLADYRKLTPTLSADDLQTLKQALLILARFSMHMGDRRWLEMASRRFTIVQAQINANA